MNRYIWLSLLCFSLFSIPLAAKDGATFCRAMEVQHFTQAPGVDVTPSFLDYFHVSLKEYLQKNNVAAQIYDDGATPAADASEIVLLEGKFTSQAKHIMGIRTLDMEINLYRKSDHRLVAAVVAEAAYKVGFSGEAGKSAAEIVGKDAAFTIKKQLKDAPALASLPPAAAPPANVATAPAAAPAPSAPKLGIQARALTDGEAQKLAFAQKTGVYVIRVEKDSLAELMQLQSGDVIMEVNGNKVAGVDELRQLLGNGSNVMVKVWRNGTVQQLTVPQSL